MEEIIQKAIEGGWKPNKVANFPFPCSESCVLDPLFWQALGKACEWSSDDIDISDPYGISDSQLEALEHKAEQRGCAIPDGTRVVQSQIWKSNNPYDIKEGVFTKVSSDWKNGYIKIIKQGNKSPSQYWAGFWIDANDWKTNALHFHEINLTEGWEKAVEYLKDLIK